MKKWYWRLILVGLTLLCAVAVWIVVSELFEAVREIEEVGLQSILEDIWYGKKGYK